MHLVAFGSLIWPDTSWLLSTDALLGMFTLMCLAVVAGAIVRGMIGRLRRRKRGLIAKSNVEALARFGIAVTEDDEQPDEKDLHPGRVPTKKSKGAIHKG